MSEQNDNSQDAKNIAVAAMMSKNMTVGVLLAIFFGPLGLLYSSILGGIIMIVLSLLVAFLTMGFGLIVTQIICVIWAVIAIKKHNTNLIANM